MDKISTFLSDNLLNLLGIFLSWLFTHLYYKKSLNQQAKEANEEHEQLLSVLQKDTTHNERLLKQQQIEKALEEFLKKGTPVNFINTLDIPDEEKADIYDKACLRKKGRLPKENPYKREK